MIILHIDNGTVIHLDPLNRENDLYFLDNSPNIRKKVRRVAIIDNDGKRVDLPLNINGIYCMWIEFIKNRNRINGECFCMRNELFIMKVKLYYSDKRVVIDLEYGDK